MYGVFRTDGKSERAIFVIDKNCNIRYVDVHDIDEQPDNEVLFKVLADIEGVPMPPMVGGIVAAPETAQGAPVEPPATEGQARVTMYCTSWCPACRRVRAYFSQKGITYTEVDIGRDRAAAARVRTWAKGYETTPTFDINGTIIVNFDLEKVNEVLGIKE